MPIWNARADVWFADPQTPLASASTIASQLFKVEFECAGSADEREHYVLEDHPTGAHGEAGGGHLLAENALDLPSCNIVRAQGWTRLELQLPDDRFGGLQLDVALRSANCAEGKGLIVWVQANGQFNANPNPPPFDWKDWGVKGSWQICCCCDPFGSHSWTAVNRRGPRGGSQGGLSVRLFADEKPSCDGDATSRRYDI